MEGSVKWDAKMQGWMIDVWSIVEYVAKSASVFLQELMGTSMSVLATVTSSAAKRLPSVLDSPVTSSAAMCDPSNFK